MPSAGDLIWTALTPILKMIITCASGFFLTKAGVFPPAASRGFSQVCLNVALPGLIFSSIVPSFNSENISALGPLIMTAVFYQVTGAFMALIIRSIFWVPRHFQVGILISGMLSNWGNLPTAIVQSVATKEPFNPATDSELGVGFVSIFIAVYNVTFFTGLYKVCAWDFIEPEGGWHEEDVPYGFTEHMRRNKRGIAQLLKRLRGSRSAEDPEGRLGLRDVKSAVVDAVEKTEPTSMADAFELDKEDTAGPYHSTAAGPSVQQVASRPLSLTTSLTRQLSAAETESVSCAQLPDSTAASRGRKLNPIPASRAHSPSHGRSRSRSPSRAMSHRSRHTHHSHASKQGGVLATIWGIVRSFFTPITTSLIIALVCALVPPLKSLFVDNVEGWSGTRMPYAPDGTPILAWIQATAVFLGNITVPGGLILLGASFARLKRPDSWSRLPLAAIFSLLLTKMVILPVIGIAFVQSLSAHTTLYPEGDKMLRFVAMLLSGTPTAVNQLVVTQLCAPEGGSDTLAAFLLPQYAVMFILSTALTAISLKFVA